MKSSGSAPSPPGPWTSLWIVALLSLTAQLWLCQFFSFGERVPVTLDINPCNLWKQAYHFPPEGTFQILNWLGVAYLPQGLQPLSLAAADLTPWWFFTAYTPVVATLALLAMVAFLRELDLSRPAAIFGGLIFAWQGDLLPFIYPGHFAYMATWPFFALAAWGALRSERTGHWAYAVISGASCGLLVSLQPDRGAIASVLVGLLFIAALFRSQAPDRTAQRAALGLILCVGVAALVALAPLLSIFKSNVEGVKMAGAADRDQLYQLVTQFSLGPAETLTYLVPGFFGWHMNSPGGMYWGWIGEWPSWAKHHEGARNLNLAISTTGTVATVLALIGVGLLVWEGMFGPSRLTERQRFFGRVLLALGFIALVLSWGWHTPFYRPLFVALPFMDKWRNPLKWLEMTNFALVVLSAVGLEHLLASLQPEAKVVRQRLAWFTLGMALLMLIGLAVTYPVSLALTAELQKQGYDAQALAGIMGTLHSSTFFALVLMVLFGVVLRAVWRPEPMRTWTPVNPLVHRAWQAMLTTEHLPLTLALSLGALAVVQLGWVATQFIQPVSLQQLTQTNPLLDALQVEGNTVRCSVAPQDPLLNVLLQNQFANMGISCLDISAASRIPDDLNTFLQTLDNQQATIWFLTGVKNVVVPQGGVDQMRQDPGVAANMDHAAGYTLAPTCDPNLPSHAMVGLKQYLAKATLVPDAEYLPSDDAVLARLKDPKWNPRATLLLKGERKVSDGGFKGPAATDEIGLAVYTPTRIEISVRSAAGGYVMVNDQYDPDWTAQVNGKDAELLRADYIMRGVKVPAGNSTVTMKYAAHYHLAGHRVSALAMNNLSDGAMLAAWLIAAFALWRRPPDREK